MNIYRVKVELTQAPYDVGDGTWRAIEIKGNQTLQLHRTIFKAFDRWEHHLYSFFMSADRRDHTKEYASPDFFEEEEWEDELPQDASTPRLDSLGLAPRTTFDYVFDYGDDWEHRLTVLSIRDETPVGRYPRITEREGDSPPQYPLRSDSYDDEPDDEPEEDQGPRGRVIPFRGTRTE